MSSSTRDPAAPPRLWIDDFDGPAGNSTGDRSLPAALLIDWMLRLDDAARHERS